MGRPSPQLGGTSEGGLNRHKGMLRMVVDRIEHCAALLDSLSDGAYIVDRSGRCGYINRVALEQLGRSPEEVIGHSPHHLFHRGHAEDCPACCLVAGGTTQTGEDVFVQKAGGAVAVRITASPLGDGMAVVFRGSEEPAQTALLRHVFDASEDAILILEGDRFVDCNEAAVRMLRCRTKDEVKSLSPWDLSPECQPDGRPSRQSAMEMIARAHQERWHRFEWVHTRADGASLPVEVTLTAVDLNGRTVLHVVWKDIAARRRTAASALETQLRLTDIVDFLPDATLIVNQRGEVVAWNRAMEVMTGVDAEDMIGRGDHAYSIPFYGHRRPILVDTALHLDEDSAQRYAAFARHGDTVIGESYTPTLPAGRAYLHATASILRNAGGEVIGAIESMRDITQHKQLEEALREAESRFRTLFVHSKDAMMTLAPPSWKFTSGNPAALTLFGVGSEEEFTGLGPWDVSPRRQPDGQLSAVKAKAMIERAMRDGSHFFEWTHRLVGGRSFPCTVLLTRVEILGQGLLQATVRDITEQKRAERQIQRLAHFDALTGLPNRALLMDRVGQAIRSAGRDGQPLALMFLDLDYFKDINDTLGHRVGDKLLVQLAARLRQVLRAQDTAARLGGDEFILLLPGTGAAGATHVATRLLQTIAQPFRIDGHVLAATPSIGIALYPQDGGNFDALSRLADTAMYWAKQGGRNTFRFYKHEPEHSVGVPPQP